MSAVIALSEALIRCPSVTPDDAGCQQIIRETLTPLGFQCDTMPFADVTNLWARYGKTGPLLVFAGHTDVVPPGPREDWQSDPFAPEIRDGYLYGRGASDMKSAIAAMMVATQRFISAYPAFHGSIAFLITSDEEAKAINGTRKVLEALATQQVTIDYAVVGEPSSDQAVGDQIRIGRRGSLHGKLIAHGKQGHVAHPHLANNPIHQSMAALHTLAHTEWDQGNADFPPTTLQITNINAGTGAANVIPGHLAALFNFRFSTAVTIAGLKQRVHELLDHHGLKYDLEWEVGADPFLTNRGKLVTATQAAIQTVTGRTVKLSTGGGTSDARFIAKTGAEVVELGVSHATAHHVDECVRVSDVEALVEIYEALLKKLFL